LSRHIVGKDIFVKLRFVTIVFLVAVAMIAGCPDKRAPKGPTGTVSGTVKYKGAPVTVGSVVFQNPTTKNGGAASLDSEGKFTISEPMEVGEYNVGFPPPFPPAPHEDAKPVASPLPSKYHLPEQGAVKFAIDKGENTADFNLD